MEAHEQLPLQTLKERTETQTMVVYGQHGLIDETGGKDWPQLVDKIYAIVSRAIVELPGQRAKVAIPKTEIISQVFPKLPGPTDWVDEDDPELAEQTYGKISSDVLRVLKLADDGDVQSRLNGELGMLLCKTHKHPQGYYITRNFKCVIEDSADPSADNIKRAMNNHAAVMALLMERLPEHARKFNNVFSTSTKLALDSGKAKVRAALDAASVKADGDGDGDSDSDE